MSLGFLRSALVSGVLLLSASSTAALDSKEMFADPEMEARAREIGRQLRCLVCQNESIFDSNAGLARDLRDVVRERMTEGDSDAEVIDHIVSRFGDYVLLEPPVRGKTLVLWIAPLAFLGFGGLALASYHRKRAGPGAIALSDEDRVEAQRLLRGE